MERFKPSFPFASAATLQNLKISSKILIIIVGGSLIGLALSIYGARQMAQVDTSYSDLLSADSAEVVKLVRAGRNVSDSVYSA